MTRIEYDLVRGERPELNLPAYEELNERALKRLAKLNREVLITYRTYMLLQREIPCIEDKELGESFVQSTPL